jgi:hypothetical protein
MAAEIADPELPLTREAETATFNQPEPFVVADAKAADIAEIPAKVEGEAAARVEPQPLTDVESGTATIEPELPTKVDTPVAEIAPPQKMPVAASSADEILAQLAAQRAPVSADEPSSRLPTTAAATIAPDPASAPEPIGPAPARISPPQKPVKPAKTKRHRKTENDWVEAISGTLNGVNPATMYVEVVSGHEKADTEPDQDLADVLAAAEKALVSSDLAAGAELTVVAEPAWEGSQSHAPAGPYYEAWLHKKDDEVAHAERLWLDVAIESLQVDIEYAQRLCKSVDEEWRRLGENGDLKPSKEVPAVKRPDREQAKSGGPNRRAAPMAPRVELQIGRGGRTPQRSAKEPNEATRTAAVPEAGTIEVAAKHVKVSKIEPTPQRHGRHLPIRKHAPLAAWARRENEFSLPPIPSVADDMRGLMAGLSVPAPIAGVTYASGCRIQRIIIPTPPKRPQSREPLIIISRRTLHQLRKPTSDREAIPV